MVTELYGSIVLLFLDFSEQDLRRTQCTVDKMYFKVAKHIYESKKLKNKITLAVQKEQTKREFE